MLSKGNDIYEIAYGQKVLRKFHRLRRSLWRHQMGHGKRSSGNRAPSFQRKSCWNIFFSFADWINNYFFEIGILIEEVSRRTWRGTWTSVSSTTFPQTFSSILVIYFALFIWKIKYGVNNKSSIETNTLSKI